MPKFTPLDAKGHKNLTSDVLSFLFVLFILVVLFMLFVDLLKMLVQSFLVQSKQDKYDCGHKYHLCFIQGVKFHELAVNHAASTKTLFDQKVSEHPL